MKASKTIGRAQLVGGPARPPPRRSLGAAPPATNLGFDLVVSEAEVLEVGRRVGLDRRELVLQHLDHLWQLRIPPPKLSVETRNTEAESLPPPPPPPRLEKK